MPVSPRVSAGKFELGRFSFFIGFKSGMKLSSSEHTIIGDANPFDFFKVEKSFAIAEGMRAITRTGGLWESRTGKASMMFISNGAWVTTPYWGGSIVVQATSDGRVDVSSLIPGAKSCSFCL